MTARASLTPRQCERRARVIRAALGLAREGGYDAVQIRAVAARAEVARGTVYRYFVSKDHLLAAAMVQSVGALERDVAERPPVGATVADRVLDVFDRSFTNLSEHAALGMALLTALNSPGPEVAQEQDQLHQTMASVIGAAFTAETDPGRLPKLIRTIEHIWGSVTTGWMIGWMSTDQVRAEFADGIRLLLEREDR